MPGMRTLDQRAIQSMPTLQDAFAMADNAERPTAITQAVSALVDRLANHSNFDSGDAEKLSLGSTIPRFLPRQ